MSQRQKGVQRMISEKLRVRVVYKDRFETDAERRHDAQGKALINRAVRKLVLLMRGLELHGVMTREQIENCVIRAFETAEYLYYGLSEHELMAVIDREVANDKGRKRSLKSL